MSHDEIFFFGMAAMPFPCNAIKSLKKITNYISIILNQIMYLKGKGEKHTSISKKKSFTTYYTN